MANVVACVDDLAVKKQQGRDEAHDAHEEGQQQTGRDQDTTNPDAHSIRGNERQEPTVACRITSIVARTRGCSADSHGVPTGTARAHTRDVGQGHQAGQRANCGDEEDAEPETQHRRAVVQQEHHDATCYSEESQDRQQYCPGHAFRPEAPQAFNFLVKVDNFLIQIVPFLIILTFFFDSAYDIFDRKPGYTQREDALVKD